MVLETLTVNESVELAILDRGDFVESRHAGVAVVLNSDGEVVSEHGNASALIFPRSSLKPLQAIASISAGAELVGEQLGLATASHSGTERHVSVVRGMLASGGFTEDDLECPPAWPGDTAARDDMVREGLGQARIRMNCSGKHAAMLLACRAAGWETRGYTDLGHPLQVHTREVVERFIGEKVATTAIDGCGAPIHAMTVLGLARAVHRVGTSSERSPFAMHRTAGAIVSAVREHPWTIAGPNLADTVLIEELGVFAKTGAEGVFVITAQNGTTAVIKILDGSTRAAPAVGLSLLAQAGAVDTNRAAVAVQRLDLTVLGGGNPVGSIRPTVRL